MNSATVFAGTFGLTTISSPYEASSEIGVKSLIGSYESDFSVTAMYVWVPFVVNSRL